MKDRVPMEIIERASEWFLELSEPDVPAEQRSAFCDWLRESPVHVRAYLEIASVWEDSALVDEAKDFGLEEAMRAGADASNITPLHRNIAEDARIASTNRNASAASNHAVGQRRKLTAWAAAACIVLAVGAGAFFLRQHDDATEYRAPVDKQRLVALDDGSIVHLNMGTRLRVAFRPDRRSLELVSGQALFEVAKDVRRPFVVHSGEATIRAIGTAFDVDRADLRTVITVLEGRVLVSSSHERRGSAGPTRPLPAGYRATSAVDTDLSAGEQALVTGEGSVERRRVSDVSATSAWLKKDRVFVDEPLGVIAEEFNRHNQRAIRIEDAALADLRVNAVFHTTDPQSLVTFIRHLEPVEVEATATEIRISRHAP